MKKIVGTIAAIALAASSAFAGANFGMGFNRGVWMPVKGDGNDVKVFEGTSWGGAARQGLSFSASSENMGVAIDINGDDGGLGVGDVSCLWAQPWSWLKVTIGKAQDDTGRGCAGFGVRDWGRTSEAAKFDDDFTFTRFGNGTGGQAVGAIVKVTPVDGLWAVAAFDINDNDNAENAYTKKAQYGAGYVIDGIGHIRAQYIGQQNSINAAFDLTAVDNLALSVGAYIPLEENAETKIRAYAKFSLDAITLHLLEAASIDGSTFVNDAAVGLDYDFGNGLGLNADVRVKNATDMNVSFMAGLKKSLANGFIGLGFEGSLVNVTTDASFSWAVPVVISAWF